MSVTDSLTSIRASPWSPVRRRGHVLDDRYNVTAVATTACTALRSAFGECTSVPAEQLGASGGDDIVGVPRIDLGDRQDGRVADRHRSRDEGLERGHDFASDGIGSRLSCGIAAWPPLPLIVALSVSADASSGPAVPTTVPRSIVGQM
jgi:hypothetical protein